MSNDMMTPQQVAYQRDHPDELGVPFRFTCEQHLSRFDGIAVELPFSFGVLKEGAILCIDCAAALGNEGTWHTLPNT